MHPGFASRSVALLIVILTAFVPCGQSSILKVEPSVPTVQAPSVPTAIDALRFDAVSGPVSFEQNRGQWGPGALFKVQAGAYDAFLTATGMTVVLSQPLADDASETLATPGARLGGHEPSGMTDHVAIAMTFEGASRPSAVLPQERQAQHSNYLIGDRSDWVTDVAHFGRVLATDVYPGIDVAWYGTPNGQVEYDFLLDPGADAGAIRLRFDGADSIRLDDGELVLGTALGPLVQHPPRTYQPVEGGPAVPVASGFVLDADGTVRFQVGAHDPRLPLVIDPLLTHYSTFVGGSAPFGVNSMAVDGTGNAYALGSTTSTSFPTTTGAYQTAAAGGNDAALLKLNAQGTGLVYATYLGGSGGDTGSNVQVDSSGQAYVSGRTDSTNFPVTAGAYQTAKAGLIDAYVTKLNAAGNGLLYSTYLGGTADEFRTQGVQYGGGCLQVDAAGNAFLAGVTASTNFPTTVGAYQTAYAGGGSDFFIAKLNAAGTGLAYSTYLGGTSHDYAKDDCIAVDASGNAYLGGFTESTDLPITSGAYQSTRSGTTDIYVAKLNAAGSALSYATYLGGGGLEQAWAIDVDSSGNAYVGGYAGATGNSFPTTAGVVDATMSGTSEATLTKLNPTGTGLAFSTFVGGSGSDSLNDLDVDSSGRTHLVAYTTSTDIATTSGAFQTSSGDGFYALLAAGAGSLVYATYAGGSSGAVEEVVALSAEAFVGGYASTDFQTTSGAYQTSASAATGFLLHFLEGNAPGTTAVSSSSHPDPARYYPATTFTASLSASAGSWPVAGFSHSLAAGLSPPALDNSVDTTLTSVTYTGLADGAHTFQAKAVDTKGNPGPTASRVVRVDTTPPTTPSVSSSTHPSPTAYVASSTFTASWTTPTDALSGLQGYSYAVVAGTSPPTLDNVQDAGGATTSATVTGLTSGTYTFGIKAVDAAGNWGATASRTFKVDVSAPPAPSLASSSHPTPDRFYPNSGTFTLSWSATDAHSGVTGYSYDLVMTASAPALDTVADPLATSKSYSVTGPLNEYWFRVRAADAMGNWGPVSTYHIGIDRVAPTATLIEPGNVSHDPQQAIVIAYADEDGGADPGSTLTGVDVATVVLRVDGETVGSPWTTACAPVQAHVACTWSVDDTGLEYHPAAPWTDGTHTIGLYLADTAGRAWSYSWTFVMDIGGPYDGDHDLAPDAVEPTLCSQENPLLGSDGRCSGSDWTAPTPDDMVTDVFFLLEDFT